MNFQKDAKKYWNKFWFLLWKDDSFKGWAFSILFIFIFIKFIFFPTLSLVTQTPLPLAIVESCSMYHKGNLLSNFNLWFERHESKYSNFDVEKEQFSDFRFKNGLNKGDILFVIGANTKKLEVGDTIIFNAQRNPIIHRVIEIRETENGRIFSTIGDNNNGQLFFENGIKEEQIIGEPILKIAPYLGWVKLVFFESFKSPSDRGFCKEN